MKALRHRTRISQWLGEYRAEILVVCILVAVVMVSILTYFDFHLEMVPLGNTSFPIPRVSPRSQQIDTVDATGTLFAGAGVLATVFAIVFALSQFLVSNVAERYSPRMVDILRASRQNWMPLVTFSSFTVFFFSFPLIAPLMKGLAGLVV